jgi:DNA-binding transcriptional ArsR family regulator
MIRFESSPGQHVGVRIACSALWECVCSVRVTRDPARYAPLRPWMRSATAPRDKDRHLLAALVRADGGYVPDFLAPPPREPGLTFDDELERFRATPPEVVGTEMDRAARESAPAAELATRFRRDARGLRDTIADALERYWKAALAPDWPRLEAVLEGEILARARVLALGGPGAVLNALHPSVAFAAHGIDVESPQNASVPNGGRDLLLVPSVFAWPDVFTVHDPAWRASLYYPARGIGTLWSGSSESNRSDPLETLAGRGRASVLRALTVPSTTEELAVRLRLAPSSVSEHLQRLRRAGLLDRFRLGPRVYYQRSPAGQGVVDAVSAIAEPS